jgi:hypothetical protein
MFLVTSQEVIAFGTPVAVGILAIIQALTGKKIEAERLKTEAERIKAAEEREAQRLATVHAEEAIKRKLEEQDRAAEQAARDVKDKLAIAAAETLLKLEVIRIEGNSKMSAQKKESMEAWQIAAKASKDPEHEAKARHAQKIWQDHIAAEKLADDRVRLFVEQERLKLLRLVPPDAPQSP